MLSAAVVIDTLRVNTVPLLYLPKVFGDFNTLTLAMLNALDATPISKFQPIRLLNPDC